MTRPLVVSARKGALADRGHDLYETPPDVVRALLAHGAIPTAVWEPACGPGSIVRVLRESGRRVLATDLVDYASPDQDAARIDFLMECPPSRHRNRQRYIMLTLEGQILSDRAIYRRFGSHAAARAAGAALVRVPARVAWAWGPLA